MKKITRLVLTVFLSFMMLTGLTGCGDSDRETLRVFNWGVYIDPAVIVMFEEEFNVRVIYEEYHSNEMMYTRLISGEVFDILKPSDYMIERLISEGMIQPIDFSRIEGMDGIMPGLLNLPFDPYQQYSVPYFWGNVGLVFNRHNVPLELLEEQGWNILQNTDFAGRIYMYDSERDSFMVALKALGFSQNTEDEHEIMLAYEWLVQVHETMNPEYVMDEVLDNMIAGRRDIAVVYSGCATWIIHENPDMDFFVPEAGTNLWVDAMVIMTDAPNPDMAHNWINFMLRPEIARMNASYIGYTPVLQDIFDELGSPGGLFYGISSFTPRLDHPTDDMFRYNEPLRVRIAELWIRILAR